ncbi:MAG: MBL fold metallo-hydrolase, partial [Nitrospinota bacterium]
MSDKRVALERSTDMVPVEGSVEVAIPVHLLWQVFLQARWWPRWNRCFFWVFNRSLQAGKRLIWCFEPIRRWYLYKLPAIATVVEVEPERKVTWEVTILPGFYARHTYFMEDLEDGRTRFGSWEKAQGWSFRLCRWFWIPHFVFVRDQSLQGARRLEEVYRREGKLTEEVLEPRRYRWFFLTLLLVVLFLAAGGFAGWFYFSFVRLTVTELAPGVYALFGGGGNSLVVHDNGEVLLVDPKFPPVSRWVERWIARHLQVPVTLIVNTHYHFDHTRGNIHYPGAQIIAHRMVPELMRRREGSWWDRHPQGIPPSSGLVDTTRALHVGEQEIIVTYPGPAHTAGDLWVYLQRDGVTIVATGD